MVERLCTVHSFVPRSSFSIVSKVALIEVTLETRNKLTHFNEAQGENSVPRNDSMRSLSTNVDISRFRVENIYTK